MAARIKILVLERVKSAKNRNEMGITSWFKDGDGTENELFLNSCCAKRLDDVIK